MEQRRLLGIAPDIDLWVSVIHRSSECRELASDLPHDEPMGRLSYPLSINRSLPDLEGSW